MTGAISIATRRASKRFEKNEKAPVFRGFSSFKEREQWSRHVDRQRRLEDRSG
jgi:hypothetical protein